MQPPAHKLLTIAIEMTEILLETKVLSDEKYSQRKMNNGLRSEPLGVTSASANLAELNSVSLNN